MSSDDLKTAIVSFLSASTDRGEQFGVIMARCNVSGIYVLAALSSLSKDGRIVEIETELGQVNRYRLATPDERVLHLLADGKSYTMGQIEQHAGGLPNEIVDAVARLTGSGKIDYYTNSKGAFYYSKQ